MLISRMPSKLSVSSPAVHAALAVNLSNPLAREFNGHTHASSAVPVAPCRAELPCRPFSLPSSLPFVAPLSVGFVLSVSLIHGLTIAYL